MARNIGLGLARLTVAAPHSRIDVVLPEHVPVAELLPGLLHRAGGDLADIGQQHEGWTLRSTDGTALDVNRSLAVQGVLDGQVLYLVARRTEWPEPEVDDLVDAIAVESRWQTRPWSRNATRIFGLIAAEVLLLALLGLLVSVGTPWTRQGFFAAALAVTLLLAGTVLSRALSDSSSGAWVASVALVYGAIAPALLDDTQSPLRSFGTAQLLAACGGLFAASVIADVGVASRSPLFVAGATTAALGAAGVLLHHAGLSVAGAASLLASILIVFMPAIPLLSLRMAKVPTPNLPATAEDLTRDDELPARADIRRRVVRSDQLFTGFLFGTSVVLAICEWYLVVNRDLASTVLIVLITACMLLRARLYPTLQHRLPLLVTTLFGTVTLGVATLSLATARTVSVITGCGVALAAVAVASGLRYSRRKASPSLGRLGDFSEGLAVVSMVPVACAVMGVYGRMRGIAG